MTSTPSSSRPWTPSDRDRMIYRWVKFDGHKQSWVADQLDLNQSSVSRIIDRYERWVAHGGPAQQGGLNREERLRAQLWLTFERNEWIINSALRLAGEMERLSDASKSTTTHHCSDPSREIEVRTENSIRDRTGLAHRYLNLANRVGKYQMQLLEKYDLPALEPLTLDPNEYSEALADSRSGFQSGNTPFEPVPENGKREASASRYDDFTGKQEFEFGAGLPTPPPPRPQVSCPADTLTRRASEVERSSTSNVPAPEFDHSLQISNFKSEICAPPPPLSPSPTPDAASLMHPVHNANINASPLTPTKPTISVEVSPHKKPAAYAYPVAATPPEPTEPLAQILAATTHQPLPPIRIYPIHMPLES